MRKVKVLGAGSIGNHLAQASRRMGWDVDMCDVDPEALKRTKESIYPSRYGAWDDAIGLYSASEAPAGPYDLVVVGTPPDSHIPLALGAVREGAKAVLIEKPACPPDLSQAQELFEAANAAGTHVFVGYNHSLSDSARRMSELLQAEHYGTIETLDVEFREYWGGIFAAHPWLDGPADSYLGYWQSGGGAAGEHSHAIHLWQTFARDAGQGRIRQVSAAMKYVTDGKVEYDSIAALHLTTDTGMIGRVIQDVITEPSRKWARAQSSKGYVEWLCESGTRDTVQHAAGNADKEVQAFPKTRPDDFFVELQHIDAILSGSSEASPIDMTHGLETVLVIAATHLSAWENRPVEIDYSRGFIPDALNLA